MVGISNGTANVQNYSLLKGVVQMSFLNPSTGLPYGWRDVGNSCDLSLSMETQTDKHYQCRQRVRTADLEYVTELDVTASLRFDEWMFENLSTFTLGAFNNHTSVVVPAASNATGFAFINPRANAELLPADSRIGGKWYDLGVNAAGTLIVAGVHGELTANRRIYNVTAGDIEITIPAFDPGGGSIGPFTYTGVPMGTTPGALEFVVNEEFGTFYIETGPPTPTSTLAANLTSYAIATNNLTSRTLSIGIELTSATTASAQQQVQGVGGNQVAVAIRIVGVNGANAVVEELLEVIMHQVILRPNGQLPLISESELGRFTVDGTLQANIAADPAGNGYFTIRKVSA